MRQYFPTKITRRLSREESDEWAALRGRWYEKNRATPGAPREYAQRYGSLDEILAPAGCWLHVSLSEQQDAKQLAVLYRIVEVARKGCPDLFEAKLALIDYEQSFRIDISETVPSHSVEEATDRFKAALVSERACAMAAVVGDTVFTRAFGVAVSPECLTQQLKGAPAPTSSEVRQLSDELSKAMANLFEVIDRWEGTDALAHLRLSSSTSGPLRRLEYERKSSTGVARLLGCSGAFDNRAARRGRPMKGGTELALAHALAEIWQNCGLGEPKVSAQSRFIRACGLALPWHNVFKADVAQFMRGEAKKKRQRNVLMD